MRISDWSSDVCSSDLSEEVDGKHRDQDGEAGKGHHPPCPGDELAGVGQHGAPLGRRRLRALAEEAERRGVENRRRKAQGRLDDQRRSEEHTSELQSLMRISYAVFCLKEKNTKQERRAPLPTSRV